MYNFTLKTYLRHTNRTVIKKNYVAPFVIKSHDIVSDIRVPVTEAGRFQTILDIV